MGKRGPKTQPAAIAKRKGTYQPCRHGEDNVKSAELACPTGLGEVAARNWHAIAPMLGRFNITAETDELALKLFCEAIEDYVAARDIVTEQGITTVGSQGNLIMHPAVRVRESAFSRVLKMAQEFGMTPSARTNVKATPGEEEEDDTDDILQMRPKVG